MSAYVVENKTINRIVTGLRDAAHRTSGPLIHLKVPFSFTGDEQNHREQAAELARRMRELNEAAVRTRYPKHNARKLITGEPLVFTWTMCNPWQLLRSLDCFLYQCGEGTVPETELYQKLDKVRVDLAGVLARRTDQYQACEWG